MLAQGPLAVLWEWQIYVTVRSGKPAFHRSGCEYLLNGKTTLTASLSRGLGSSFCNALFIYRMCFFQSCLLEENKQRKLPWTSDFQFSLLKEAIPSCAYFSQPFHSWGGRLALAGLASSSLYLVPIQEGPETDWCLSLHCSKKYFSSFCDSTEGKCSTP